MATYYLVTIYVDGRARYHKTDNLEEALQICENWSCARIQKKLKGKLGCSKFIYEKHYGEETYY